jgi:hypothetical protein
MAIPPGRKWIKQIFEAKAAGTGGTPRRKVASVERYASGTRLHEEVLEQGRLSFG